LVHTRYHQSICLDMTVRSNFTHGNGVQPYQRSNGGSLASTHWRLDEQGAKMTNMLGVHVLRQCQGLQSPLCRPGSDHVRGTYIFLCFPRSCIWKPPQLPNPRPWSCASASHLPDVPVVANGVLRLLPSLNYQSLVWAALESLVSQSSGFYLPYAGGVFRCITGLSILCLS